MEVVVRVCSRRERETEGQLVGGWLVGWMLRDSLLPRALHRNNKADRDFFFFFSLT
jgi:hypothetical protein